LEQGLAGAGLDLTAATATDRYVWLDAAETLARFMVDGLPDPERFVEAIEPVVADPIGGGREVRVFGEMVALLASAGDYAAAVRLEGLWNSLRDRHGFTLFCAYPISSFDADRSGRQLEAVCAAHSQVIPTESFTALAQVDDRAREIASLQRKARRLEAEIREREQAVRLRDEFLSVASHELRTPLTTISAHAQVMLRRLVRDSSADPAAVQRSFEVIVEQSGKLARLVSQLLDVSRLQGGKLTLERRPTELRGLVERVAAAVAMGSGQPIEVQAPEAVTARVDPLRLDQLLTNLLDNAVKYGASEGPIAVELARRAGAIEIAVRDHGPGIPPDQRARVFERFFQAHTDSYASGMGLGLYIARQIAELHGGALRAEFPPDGGSRFVLTLPSA
jgi:signal transduction histidine kinase